jgi:hypothetical protein
MADNNGHKSYGFGFFNPDDRLKQIINDIASAKDLKSLRCTFLLLLEHPEIKPRILERYGEQAYKEMFDKYNVTTKAESEDSKRKEDTQKKARIQAFQVLGFSSEDSEKLSELSSEDLKTLAYIKQNTPQNRINQEEKRKETREYKALIKEKQEIEDYIRRQEKELANHPDSKEYYQTSIDRAKERLTIADQKLKAYLEQPTT